MRNRCSDELLHEIAQASIADVTELVKAAVLLMEDLPVSEFERLRACDQERVAYDRLAQAVRKIK